MSVIMAAILALGALPGSDIKEPKRVKHVAPEYPQDAARAGLRGRVMLACSIDTEGKVGEMRVLSGVPPLTDAAMKAVKQWRYTPTRLNGVAVPVNMTITVDFMRELHFRLEDLLDSLRSQNEFIRESAVTWLGGARGTGSLKPSEISRVIHEVGRLAESDESARVRTVAAQAIQRLEAK